MFFEILTCCSNDVCRALQKSFYSLDVSIYLFDVIIVNQAQLIRHPKLSAAMMRCVGINKRSQNDDRVHSKYRMS
jgi:hypothetical protein